MINHLAGVTHAVVSIPKEVDAKASGISAVVDLCFGQGNTSICGLKYVKEDGRMYWRAPMIQVLRDGKWISLSVFKGDLLMEFCEHASRAIARVKQQFGRPVWGHQYTVLKDRVVERDAEGKETV